MGRILIATLPGDEDAAAAIRQRLLSTYPDTRVISQADAAIPTLPNPGDAVLVLVNDRWTHQIKQYEAVYRFIEDGLKHSDLPVIAVLIDGATLPPVMDIPEHVRALAYMTSVNIDRQQMAQDADYVANMVHGHLQREKNAPAARVGAYHSEPDSKRGTPWNLIILISALVLGIILLIASSGSDGYGAGSLLPLARATQTSEPDPFAPTTGDVLLALVANVGDDPVGRAQTMINGAELALLERPELFINGESLRLELAIIDSPCSARAGLQAAQILTEIDELAGVVGHMCDTSCAAATSRYDEAGITTISPACTGPELAGISNTFNRSLPSASYAAVAAAEFITSQFDTPRVAVIHDELPRYREIAARFTRAYEPISGVYPIVTTALDPEELVAQVLAEEPEAIYYAGRAETAIQFVDQLGGLPLIMAERDIVQDLLANAPPLAEGVFTLTLLSPDNDALSTLAERYTEHYISAPEGSIWAYAYDAVNMLLDGLEAVGTVGENGRLMYDRAALQEYVRNYQSEGITGSLVCDGSGDCASAPAQVYTVQDGVITEITIITP